MKTAIQYFLIIVITATISSVITGLYLSRIKSEAPKKDMVHIMNLIYEELELENVQIEKFNSLTGQFHMKGKLLSKEIQANSREYYKIFTLDRLDTIALSELATEYGTLQTRLRSLTTRYYRDMEDILNPHQLQKLKTIYLDALEQTKNQN